MSDYLLISSRDPVTCPATREVYELASALCERGHAVTLFLIENGVLAARATADYGALRETAAAGVKVLADDFALRQRAISANALLAGVEAAGLDHVIDALAAGAKTIWH
jgi:sulfur relay (sulfurtransferase) complex TusBCD TusD component (DsrE family)